jgi:hypothetical protein
MTNKITILDDNIDLYICHSWFNNGAINGTEHGICGHTFEMIEYYWIMKDKIKCKLLWTESLTWDQIELTIRSKYNFNDNEIFNIKENSTFVYNPLLLKGNNILIVDGDITRMKATLLFKNIIMFACGNRELYKIEDTKYHILQNENKTSYGQVYRSGPRTQHYKKKILFSRFKPISKKFKKRTLLYLTGNCRKMNIDDLQLLIKNYNLSVPRSTYLIATDEPEYYRELESDNIEIKKMPIEDFLYEFDNYIYTPLNRRWDCSNRLLAECKYYGKNFQSRLPQDYTKDDLALLDRQFDVSNPKRFKNISLKDNDEIINIIKECIK